MDWKNEDAKISVIYSNVYLLPLFDSNIIEMDYFLVFSFNNIGITFILQVSPEIWNLMFWNYAVWEGKSELFPHLHVVAQNLRCCFLHIGIAAIKESKRTVYLAPPTRNNS